MKKIILTTVLIIIFVAAFITIIGLMVDEGFWCKTDNNLNNGRLNNYFCSFARGNINIIDPASMNCLNKGGEIITETSSQGQKYSICRLAGGAECEVKAYLNGSCQAGLSLEYKKNSEVIAFNWLTYNSPTYVFDGFEIKLKKTIAKKCPYCFEFLYSFLSRNSAYGDRREQQLDKKITPHIISINVENGKITSAIIDNRFDEFNDNKIKTAGGSILEKVPSIELISIDKKAKIGQAQLAYHEGKTYCHIAIDRLPEQDIKTIYSAWLIKDNLTGQYFSLGRLNFDINTQKFQLDLITDGNKTDYRQVAITIQSSDKIIRPETRLAEGVFPQSISLIVD